MYKRDKKQDEEVERFPVEYYGLRFEQQIQQNKLLIRVYDDKNVIKYSGCMDVTPNMNLDGVCNNLKEKKLKIVEINQDKLIIELMGLINICFTSIQNQEKNKFQERLRKLEQRQCECEKKIKQQENIQTQKRLRKLEQSQQQYEKKIGQQSNKIQLLQKAMEELKNSFGESLKSEIAQNIKTIDSKLEDYRKTLDEHQNQLKELNDKKMEMALFNQEKQTLQKSIESQKEKLETMETIIDKKYQTKLDKVNKQFEQAIEKINEQLRNISPFPWGFSHLNEPIKSSKWSSQLKSNHIIFNENIAQLKDKSDYFEFCLLDASFSKTIKSKQSWAIKINKKTNEICLGVCLKNKMHKQIFNSQNIDWSKTDHGFYMIDSDGFCYSQSQKEFNKVWKSFQFDDDDVIYIEYDLIETKLRFNLNKKYSFEMSIIAPPQHNAYHPCVGLRGQNSSVELIPWC